MRQEILLSTLPNETFSNRETEILALMAEGLTNKDLAGKIYLTLGTIKWYNKQIFRKLGVHNRTQAISKARELGLFLARNNKPGQSGTQPKNNLPFHLSSYVGRTRELNDLLAMIHRKSRLVTITGTGGIGKTSLALRVAEKSLPNFTHGVWFVDLSPLADPALVAQAIVQSLGIHDEPRVPYADLLVRYLGPRMLLLVLDNCEHLLEACAGLVSSLLRACPDLHIITTSREVLGVIGEVHYPLTTLSFPDPELTASLEALKQFEAVQLFIQRAGLVSPNFKMTQDNAQAIGQLCQRLEGLPLALEIAAASVNLLSVSQIIVHLDALLWKLGSSAHPLHPRHRSLQSCLDWSYSLLTASERILLQRLSIFKGGCTLEAAVWVCTDPEGANQPDNLLDSTAILGLLRNLVNKSLVVAHLADEFEPEQGMRYHLLDTINQYAQERLIEAGGVQTLRDRHLTFFRQLSEEAAPKLRSSEQMAYLKKMKTELPNLQAGLRWAMAENSSDEEFFQERLENGLLLGIALLPYWDLSSSFPREVVLLKKGLERANPTDERLTDLRARTLYTIATILSWEEVGRTPGPCLKILEESIVLFRACGDMPGLALALAKLAWMCQGIDHAQALFLGEESVAICRQVGDRWNLAEALWHMMGLVNSTASLACGQEALALYRETGDAWRVNWTLANLGGLAVSLGHHTIGKTYLEESTRFFRERGILRGMKFSNHIKGYASYELKDYKEVATCIGIAMEINRLQGVIGFSIGYLWMLGTAYLHLGDYGQSAGYFLECLSTAQDLDDIQSVCMALSGLAGVSAAINQPVRALHLMSAVEAALEARKEKLDPSAFNETNQFLPLVRSHLDPESYTKTWAEGRALNLAEAIKEAFAITI